MNTQYDFTSHSRNDRAAQIKNELVQLYNKQTEFYRKGGLSCR